MNTEELKTRMKAYAVRIVKLVESLPRTLIAQRLGDQLLRVGTSVGANYHAAARAKSRADFLHKLSIVEEECDESLFWLEIMVETGLISSKQAEPLLAEGKQLLAITVASIRTARQNKTKPKTIRSPQSAINNSL